MRRAGTGRTPSGDRAWWSVAEGRRGRRWREAIVGPDGLRHSLLLETFPDGRFSHLELATPAGLLTLHPEPDGTLHGNAIEAAGVRHVVGLAWAHDGAMVIEASAVAGAAAVLGAGEGIAVGTTARRTVLRVTADLGLEAGEGGVERLAAGEWRVDGGASFRVDADGLPMLADAIGWPLELAE